ncbi:glycosyltransferase family 4 protein [Geodermatophilus aquaeductus]|uniref:glycosyltransferase family 4 protein n=1 Tax=Geodermatophilus aquaeductus TaxID=1564161 RepID=UPI001C8EA867|nr:glycosyltransferase family 4 protein [Geodermatophilus aquaeductus]
MLWVSTSRSTRGGVATYVRNAEATGLWQRWAVRHIATHSDGSRLHKAVVFVRGALRLSVALTGRPDLVHVHASARGSFLRKAILIRVCRLARVPVVTHVHDGTFDEFYRGLGRVAQGFVRRTFSHSDVVLALGPRWAARLRALFPDVDVRAVPNGVSHRRPQPVDQPEDGVHVVFLGQIGDLKGTFDLLTAWGALRWPAGSGHPRLTIAGNGEVDRARAVRRTLPNASSVEVLDWLDPADVGALLDSAHVLVLPSTHEGQPMSVLEAMAHGLCIVASDVGGVPDLVEDGTTAVLLPPRDPVRLAATLERVVADAGLRRRLGAAAWRKSAEFDLRTLADRIEAIYLSVLAPRRATPGGERTDRVREVTG